MRWTLVAALAASFVKATDFKIDDEELAGWLTPPLLPLMKDAGTTELFPMADCFGFKLEEATIDDMQKAMEKGKLTSVQLVLCYMLRAQQTHNYIK